MNNNELNQEAFSELCQEYGYKLNDTFRERIGSALNAKMYGHYTCFPEEENILAIAEFIDFLRSVGDKIKMDGIIEKPRHNETKETHKKYCLNNGFLKNKLLLFLNEILAEEECVSEERLQAIISIHQEKVENRNRMPENAKKGYKVWLVYNLLWDAGIFHQQDMFTQKEFCFIYDCAILAGWKIEYIGKGFRRLIGREKSINTRHWFEAYQKWNSNFQ